MLKYLMTIFAIFLNIGAVKAQDAENMGCLEVNAIQCTEIAIDYTKDGNLLAANISQSEAFLTAALNVADKLCLENTTIHCFELISNINLGELYFQKVGNDHISKKLQRYAGIFEQRCSDGDYISCSASVPFVWKDKKLSSSEQDKKAAGLQARIADLTGSLSEDLRKKCWNNDAVACLERGMFLELNLINAEAGAKNKSYTNGPIN